MLISGARGLRIRVPSLGGDEVKQAVLVSIQVPKGLGCQAGDKAKAQDFRGAQRPGAKGRAELRWREAAQSSLGTLDAASLTARLILAPTICLDQGWSSCR